jgi:hypothetical protein
MLIHFSAASGILTTRTGLAVVDPREDLVGRAPLPQPEMGASPQRPNSINSLR